MNAAATAKKGRTGSSGRAPAAEVLFRREASRTPKLTSAAVKEAETTLGVKLPRAYVALLRKRNGGKLRFTGFRLSRRSPRWFGGRPIYAVNEIAGIHGGCDSLLSQAETVSRYGVPGSLVPFGGGDGQAWLCFDYRQGGPEREPSLTHVDCESGKARTFRVAGSFNELLCGLDFDSGEQTIFAIDDRDLLGEPFQARVRALGCRVRRIPGDPKGASPRAWRWPKYRASCVDEVADFFLFNNGSIDPWHLARPLKHPLLLLDVHPKDQDSAARELRTAIGEALALIHVPADRKPIAGMPVAPSPRTSVAAARAHPLRPTRVDPTDLNAAVLARDRKRVVQLLEIGAEPDKRYGPGYSTALEVAARHGLESIFNVLLRHARRKPTAVVLTLAVRGGSMRIVGQLLDAGVGPKPSDLAVAITARNAPVVRLLLEHGVCPNAEAVRRAAGVTTPNEIGFPNKPAPEIMRLVRDAGLKSTNKETRRRFERLR